MAKGRNLRTSTDDLTAHGIPVRQATRLLNEFQLDGVVLILPLAGRSMDRYAALVMVLRTALREGPGARVSSHAIACSLRRPPETVRRHVQALCALGLLDRSDDGYRVGAGLLHGEAMAALCAALRTRFARLCADWATFVGGAVVDPVRSEPSVVLLAVCDILLAGLELTEARALDARELLVLSTVAVINAAGITHDPVLSRRFGGSEDVPPRELRRPASLRAVASYCGLPRATVGRHLAALEATCSLDRSPQGFLLADRWMDDPHTSAMSREKILHFRRLLTRLASAMPAATAQ